MADRAKTLLKVSKGATRRPPPVRRFAGSNLIALRQSFTGRAPVIQSSLLQPALRVGAANDPLECEAESNAERIVAMPSPELAPPVAGPSLGGQSNVGQALRAAADDQPDLDTLESAPPVPADHQNPDVPKEEDVDTTELVADDMNEIERGTPEDAAGGAPAGETPAEGTGETPPPSEGEPAAQPARSGDAAVVGAGGGAAPADVAGRVAQPGSGRPMPATVRGFMEPRFGKDFSDVRIHDSADDRSVARRIGARAFTHRQHIWIGPGEAVENRRLMAHELTHVVQQTAAPVAGVAGRASGAVVQRYESGEHAQFGDVRKQMQALINGESVDYTVKPGERLDQIARKFGVTVEALKKANSAKLKLWDAFDGSGRKIVGFNAGEKIVILPVLNAEIEAALKSSSGISFTINGVTMDYGAGIAMGDFFESPEQMANASKVELDKLATLIKRERSGGKVRTDEWEAATGGRYSKLAEKNEAHFAPSNTRLAPASGKGTADHKTEWEKHHTSALGLSQKGNKNQALRTNAFGDHFLTDAFAGGHLINKRDVMQLFQSKLVNAKGEFTGDATKFFDSVSKSSFKGMVKSTFSKYETVAFEGGIFRPNINSESRFATLLTKINEREPDVLSNATAMAVHKALNELKGGIPVENKVGDSWNLSGDGTLNSKSRTIARKAVAQSLLNVLGVFKAKVLQPIASLLKKVWDFVPRPTKKGTKIISAEVRSGTDPANARLVAVVSDLIKNNYKKILDELEKRGFLRKA